MRTLFDQHRLAHKILEFNMLQRITDDDDQHLKINFSGQGKVLLVLAEEDNLSQKEIANRLEMSSQATAEFIQKLILKKLVSKSKSPNDGRVYLIKLSSKGRHELKKIGENVPAYVQFLNDDDQVEYERLLNKMTEGMSKSIVGKDASLFDKVKKIAYEQLKEHFLD